MCSSSQESGTAFIYCRRVCIINYYYLGRWWAYVHQLRTRTTPTTSNARIDDLYVQPYILQKYVMPQGESSELSWVPSTRMYALAYIRRESLSPMTALLSPTSRCALAQGGRPPTPRILWRRGVGFSNSGSFGHYIRAAHYSCRMSVAQEWHSPGGYGSTPPFVGIWVPPHAARSAVRSTGVR